MTKSCQCQYQYLFPGHSRKVNHHHQHKFITISQSDSNHFEPSLFLPKNSFPFQPKPNQMVELIQNTNFSIQFVLDKINANEGEQKQKRLPPISYQQLEGFEAKVGPSFRQNLSLLRTSPTAALSCRAFCAWSCIGKSRVIPVFLVP